MSKDKGLEGLKYLGSGPVFLRVHVQSSLVESAINLLSAHCTLCVCTGLLSRQSQYTGTHIVNIEQNSDNFTDIFRNR